MHLLPSLRLFAGLALAVSLAVPVVAQDPPPPPEQQQPPAAQSAPDQAASGQKPSKPRGGSRGAVPAAKPAKATQPSRLDTRKPSPDSRQPAPAPGQQPGQPVPQEQQPPAPPKAEGLLKALQALPNTPAKPILPPTPAPVPTPAPKKRASKTAPAPAAAAAPAPPPAAPVPATPAPATPPPAASAPAAPAGTAAAPQSPPVNPPPAAQPAPVQAQPASPAAVAVPAAPPAASAPPQPPSPELGVKPFAPGAAVTPAASAARSGELNPNTYFADWIDGAPALWKAQSEDKVVAAKKGPAEPNGIPVLEMVPDKKGWASLVYRLIPKDVGLTAGDSLVCEVEVRADLGAPMDILLRMMAPGQKDPLADLHLPYIGENVWRTLRLAVTMPAAEVQTLDFALRLRGAKPGETACVRRASLMLLPPV